MKNPGHKNHQRLLHVIEACSSIKNHLHEVDREDFLNDPKTSDAIIYQLIIIGEAIMHIDNDILNKYDYPWFKIRAFRNYATHEYFNIEMWTVWDIVNIHIPKMEEVVRGIIDNEF
jgi:uncharacterized protein with HEPN domain